ncbi:hypothetical protein ACS0TY_023228 [Phlomoides rotata]
MRSSWNLLRYLSGFTNLPWMCIGDYNGILWPVDKRGRVEHPSWLFRGFREAVAGCMLSDVELVGYPFTWSRGRGTTHSVVERLDRAMGNRAWHDRFS